MATTPKKTQKKGEKKAPSAAQLKARAAFAARARAGKIKKGSSVTRAKNKPSKVQKEDRQAPIPSQKVRPVSKPAGQGSDYLVRPRRKPVPPEKKSYTSVYPLKQADVWM